MENFQFITLSYFFIMLISSICLNAQQLQPMNKFSLDTATSPLLLSQTGVTPVVVDMDTRQSMIYTANPSTQLMEKRSAALNVLADRKCYLESAIYDDQSKSLFAVCSDPGLVCGGSIRLLNAALMKFDLVSGQIKWCKLLPSYLVRSDLQARLFMCIDGNNVLVTLSSESQNSYATFVVPSDSSTGVARILGPFNGSPLQTVAFQSDTVGGKCAAYYCADGKCYELLVGKSSTEIRFRPQGQTELLGVGFDGKLIIYDQKKLYYGDFNSLAVSNVENRPLYAGPVNGINNAFMVVTQTKVYRMQMNSGNGWSDLTVYQSSSNLIVSASGDSSGNYLNVLVSDSSLNEPTEPFTVLSLSIGFRFLSPPPPASRLPSSISSISPFISATGDPGSTWVIRTTSKSQTENFIRTTTSVQVSGSRRLFSRLPDTPTTASSFTDGLKSTLAIYIYIAVSIVAMISITTFYVYKKKRGNSSYFTQKQNNDNKKQRSQNVNLSRQQLRISEPVYEVETRLDQTVALDDNSEMPTFENQ